MRGLFVYERIIALSDKEARKAGKCKSASEKIRHYGRSLALRDYAMSLSIEEGEKPWKS